MGEDPPLRKQSPGFVQDPTWRPTPVAVTDTGRAVLALAPAMLVPHEWASYFSLKEQE